MKLLWIAAVIAVLANPTPTSRHVDGAGAQSQVSTLSVSVGGRAPATLKVPAGSKAKIELQEVFRLALVPSSGPGGLTVEVRDLLVGDPSEGTVVRTLRLMPGESATFIESGTSVDVRWVAEPLALNGSRPASTSAPDGDCEDCCVTCDGVRYCSCKVTTICVECCCWQCCHIVTSSDGVAASPPSANCSGSRLGKVKSHGIGR